MNSVLRRPVICLVTRARGAAGTPERRALIGRLSEAAGAGVTMVQVRERQFDDRELLRFVEEVIGAVRGVGTMVVVNDRADIALAAGADGVHLKSDGPPPADVRAIVPAGFIIGRSVHSVHEAVRASTACDYLVFGTVFPSQGKPPDHPTTGVEGVAEVCRRVTLPVLAIGGLSVERAPAIAAAGAAGIAAISLFSEAREIGAVVRALRDSLTLPSRRD